MSEHMRRAGRVAAMAAFALGVGLTHPTFAFLTLQEAMQNETRKVVGEDGNGVASATFPTTVGGEEVRYVLIVENGFSVNGRQRPSVDIIQVTLNGDIVFDNTQPGAIEKIEVALQPPGGGLNQLTLEVYGSRGSGARVAILALQRPVRRTAGRSILPLARTDQVSTITAHNAGPSPMAARLAFFNPDGSLAGRIASVPLATYGNIIWDNLGLVAAQQGIQWTSGAVHLEWVATAMSRMSAVAVFHDTNGAAELALDDYGPFQISQQEFAAFSGQLPRVP